VWVDVTTLTNPTIANGGITLGQNGNPACPPNLNGQIDSGSPHEWRFLLARHGRGINAAFCDGSARFVRTDDILQLTWRKGWKKGPILNLPRS